jgi:uncharacterized damage-inducible protein DinB
MEITSIKSFLDYYEKVRQRTNRLIKVIPESQLNWAYKEGKYSIADQIRHIATIERDLYAEVAAGRSSRYHGCGKELADGYDNIVAFFNRLHQESLEIFSSISDEDLQKPCTSFDNVQIPLCKWLRALVEHEIHHRAELYIYLNILDVKTPPMFGLTAEEVQQKSEWL